MNMKGGWEGILVKKIKGEIQRNDDFGKHVAFRSSGFYWK